MWKKYKTTLILTTLISLFPMVIGLLLWNRMPLPPILAQTMFQTAGAAKRWQ